MNSNDNESMYNYIPKNKDEEIEETYESDTFKSVDDAYQYTEINQKNEIQEINLSEITSDINYYVPSEAETFKSIADETRNEYFAVMEMPIDIQKRGDRRIKHDKILNTDGYKSKLSPLTEFTKSLYDPDRLHVSNFKYMHKEDYNDYISYLKDIAINDEKVQHKLMLKQARMQRNAELKVQKKRYKLLTDKTQVDIELRNKLKKHKCDKFRQIFNQYIDSNQTNKFRSKILYYDLELTKVMVNSKDSKYYCFINSKNINCDDQNIIITNLNTNRFYFQRYLTHKLKMKYFPHIYFYFDDSYLYKEYFTKIEIKSGKYSEHEVTDIVEQQIDKILLQQTKNNK